MRDIRIENQASVDKLPTSDEICMDDSSGEEVLKPNQESLRSEKTLSIEEEEAQEAKPKSSPLPLDTNELTPNTTSTTKSLKETFKPLADAPVIIDLTNYSEEKNDVDKTKEEAGEEKANEQMTEASQTSSEPKKANISDPKPKRKSKRASSTKSANSSKSGNSKTRKSKVKAQKSEEETGSQEKNPKKKVSKKKSVKKVIVPNPIESTDESSTPVPKTTTSPPADKEREVKSAQSPPSAPVTPTKQPQNVGKTSPTKKQASPKKVASPNDFQKRKEAKAKRANELQDYLGTVGDTLMVEPRSDDSVSYLTVPPALQQADVNHHHGDLDKLPKSQVPSRTVNPMISMGDDGNCEPTERRISYDLEALMSHQVPPKQRNSKWENVSVITDEVETVLGENDNADVVKLGSENCDLRHTDIDLEQPSKEASTAVDCKTKSTTTFVSILEDLQNLMIRRPISASLIFVFLVATLVFLGIMLMQKA
ncbi:MAG: hypothetical protein SGBAC_011088 [Bacillariaceae sp.]